jgi:hypothetical protein
VVCAGVGGVGVSVKIDWCQTGAKKRFCKYLVFIETSTGKAFYGILTGAELVPPRPAFMDLDMYDPRALSDIFETSY